MSFEAVINPFPQKNEQFSSEILTQVLDANGLGLLSTNEYQEIFSTNATFKRIFENISGKKPGIDSRLEDILSKDQIEEVSIFLKKNISIYSLQWNFLTFDSKEFYFNVTFFKFATQNCEPEKILISFKDISEEKHQEIKLLIAQSLKSSFFNQSNDAILIYNSLTDKIIDCNTKALCMFEVSESELCGKSIFEYIEGDSTVERRIFLNSIFENNSVTRDYLFRTNRDKIFWGNFGYSHSLAKYNIGLIRITDITSLYDSKLSLLHSEKQLNSILNVIPCAYVLIDKKFYVKEFNNEYREFFSEYFGLSIYKNQRIDKLFNQEDLDTFNDCMKVAISGEPIETEKLINGKWYIIKYLPVKNHSLEVDSVLIGLLNITERKNLELSLHQSEYIHRTLLKNIPDTDIILFDKAKILIAAEGKELHKMGIIPSLLIGKSLNDMEDLFTEDSYSRVMNLAEKALLGETHTYVIQNNPEYYQVKFTPVVNDNGVVIYGICMISNITKEKNKEIALIQSELFSKSIIDSIPDNLCVLDENGKIIAVNKAWKDFSKMNCGDNGLTSEGVNYLDICSNSADQEPDAVIFSNAIKNILEGNANEFTWEYPCHSPYTQRWFSGKITRFKTEGPAKALVVHQNITERKRFDDIIKKQAHFIQKITDLVPVIILIYHIEDQELSYYNTYSKKLLGHDDGWIRSQGKNILKNLVHPEDIQIVMKAIDNYVLLEDKESAGTEYRLKKSDGKYIWVRASGVVFQRDEKGNPKEIILSAKNITDSKLVEEQLKASHKSLNEFKKALDTSSIVAITDHKGVITYVNDHFCTISGYSRQELIGNTHKVINSGHHDSEFFRDMWKTISSGNVWRGIVKNRSKNGKHYWVDTHIVPFLNDSGKPLQYIAIRTDITNLQRTKEKLQHSIEEKEGILTEVHHRVKNNMNIVISLLEMQSRRISDNSTKEAILESKNRMIAMALVHEKLYNTKEFYNIDFKTYTHKLLFKIISAYNSNAQKRITFEVNAEDITFPLDISMPLGLITNELVSNSLKHSFENIVEGNVKINLSKKVDDTWCYSFEDNGPGFKNEIKLSEIKSMGLKLIVSLTRQIGGSIKLPEINSSKFVIEYKSKIDE